MTILSLAILALYSSNGEKAKEESEYEQIDFFTLFTIGNLEDDEERRLHRLNLSLKSIVEEIKQVDEDIEVIENNEQTTQTMTYVIQNPEGSKSSKDDPIHIELSVVEERLFKIFQKVYWLDIAISCIFFIFLVLSYWYINKKKTFPDCSEKNGKSSKKKTPENQFQFDVESAELSRHVSPADYNNLSFHRDLGKTLKDFTLELNILEPQNFEKENRKRFIYFNNDILKNESIYTSSVPTNDRSKIMSSSIRKKINSKKMTEIEKFEKFISLIVQNKDKRAFEDFFKINFKIGVQSLRFVYDFKESLFDFAYLSECLIKRKEFTDCFLRFGNL